MISLSDNDYLKSSSGRMKHELKIIPAGGSHTWFVVADPAIYIRLTQATMHFKIS